MGLRRAVGGGGAGSDPKERNRRACRPRGGGREVKKEGRESALPVVAGDVEEGESVAGAVGDALALLEGIPRSASAERAKSAARVRVLGQWTYLYAR